MSDGDGVADGPAYQNRQPVGRGALGFSDVTDGIARLSSVGWSSFAKSETGHPLSLLGSSLLGSSLLGSSLLGFG